MWTTRPAHVRSQDVQLDHAAELVAKQCVFVDGAGLRQLDLVVLILETFVDRLLMGLQTRRQPILRRSPTWFWLELTHSDEPLRSFQA